MGVGRQSRWVCFGAKPDKGFLDKKISPYPEVVRGRERELTTRPRRGSWWLESRGQLVAGEQRGQLRLDRREANREVGVDPARVSQDESDSSSIVEFSLVTHASVSPYMLSGMHMHVVLHTFLCSWLTPSLFVFVRLSFYFLRSLDRILV